MSTKRNPLIDFFIIVLINGKTEFKQTREYFISSCGLMLFSAAY